jgi:hypothetical protein
LFDTPAVWGCVDFDVGCHGSLAWCVSRCGGVAFVVGLMVAFLGIPCIPSHRAVVQRLFCR